MFSKYVDENIILFQILYNVYDWIFIYFGNYHPR